MAGVSREIPLVVRISAKVDSAAVQDGFGIYHIRGTRLRVGERRPTNRLAFHFGGLALGGTELAPPYVWRLRESSKAI